MSPCGLLIILGELPGVGKTTVARELSRRLGAVHVRIDSIAEGIRASPACPPSLDDAGYQAAYRVAEDDLRVWHKVIADSVNPVAVTRKAWLAVADRAGIHAMQVDVRCSSVREHRRRIEERRLSQAAIPGTSWQEVLDLEYEAWTDIDVVMDTAELSVDQVVAKLHSMAMISKYLAEARPKDLIPAHSLDGKSDGKEIRLLQGPPFYRQACRDL